MVSPFNRVLSQSLELNNIYSGGRSVALLFSPLSKFVATWGAGLVILECVVRSRTSVKVG